MAKIFTLVDLKLPNPFYFTPDFCLSQGMDAALPLLTAGPAPKSGGFGHASRTLYLVATLIGRGFSTNRCRLIWKPATKSQAGLKFTYCTNSRK
jgi:hypothetical protein